MNQSRSTSLQAAYLLHYKPWQETSLIVDAFTLSHGRLVLMAKGVRGSAPRTRALFEPFQPVLLSWVGSSEWRTLTGIEPSGPALTLAAEELACAYYLNELLLRLLGKDQPSQPLFAHYAMALSELADRQLPLENVLRTFEVQLTENLGLLPDLSRCTPNGSKVEAQRSYDFHPANAVAVPVAMQDPSTSQSDFVGIPKEKWLLDSQGTNDPGMHADGVTSDPPERVSGETLLALSELRFDSPTVLAEAKLLMRRILRVHLGDQPLNSRALFPVPRDAEVSVEQQNDTDNDR